MADVNTTASTGSGMQFSFRQRLMEIDMFFQGTDRVHQTMRRVARYLDQSGIGYAIVGGMAVNAHHHERTTRDVDFLLTSEGFAAFRRVAEVGEFDPIPGRPRRFIDRTTHITFDVLVTGHFPGSGQPGPISYPDPSDVGQKMDELQVVDLPTLIQLRALFNLVYRHSHSGRSNLRSLPV